MSALPIMDPAPPTLESFPAEASPRVGPLERRELFPIPLFRACVPDAPRLNADLRSLALRWRASQPGVTVTNRGAYHSRQTLLESAEPAAVRLRETIRSAYVHLRRTFHGLETPDAFEPAGLEGWVNVSVPGSHHVSHTHLGQGWHWSGVYYVDAGGTAEGGGRIVFEHKAWDYNMGPRPIALVPRAPGPHRCEIGIAPEEGRLLLFPASLFHRVEPFVGSGARISIAFNIRDRELSWAFPGEDTKPLRAALWLRHYALGLYLPLKRAQSGLPRSRKP